MRRTAPFAIAMAAAACGGSGADAAEERPSGSDGASGQSGLTGPDACGRAALERTGGFVMSVGAGRFDVVDELLAPDARFDSLRTPLLSEPVRKRPDVHRALEAVRAADPTLARPGGVRMRGEDRLVIDGHEAASMLVTYDSDGEVLVVLACDIERVVRVEWRTLSR